MVKKSYKELEEEILEYSKRFNEQNLRISKLTNRLQLIKAQADVGFV